MLLNRNLIRQSTQSDVEKLAAIAEAGKQLAIAAIANEMEPEELMQIVLAFANKKINESE